MQVRPANKKTSKIASVLIIVISLFVMICWISGSHGYRNGLPGIFIFTFSTSVCFFLSGISLFLLDTISSKRLRRIAGIILASLILCIALFIVGEFIYNNDSGLIGLFLKNEDYLLQSRIDLSTFIIFILVSIVLLLLHKPKFHLFIQGILITVTVFLSYNFISYISGIHVNGFSVYMSTSFNTDLTFIILFIGVFFSSPLRYLKFAFEKKIIGYFSLVGLALTIVFFAINSNNERSRETAQWIQYSSEVLFRNQKILTLAQDIESDTRGFLVTGNDIFLEEFNTSVSDIHLSLHELKEIIKGNANQQQQIDSLADIVDSNIELRRILITLRRAEGFDKANQFFAKGMVQRSMAQLHSISNKIEIEENKLLAQQKKEHEKSLIETSRITVFFQFIIILLLVVAFIVIYKNTKSTDKSKEEIKKNNHFLQTIMENIPDVIFVKEGEELRYTAVNKAGEKLLGISREELIGKNDYDLFPKEQADHFIYEDTIALNKDKVVDIPEEKIITPQGERWLHTKKIPVREGQGLPSFLIGIAEDITERKIANDLLKDATERVFDLYNNAPCGYHSIDSKGIFIEINDTELQWLGYSREEVIGKLRLTDIFTDEERSRVLQINSEIKKTGMISDLNFDLVRKDGTIFPVIISSTAILDAKGNFIRSRSTIFDYTDRKLLDEKIKRFNQELEKKVEEKTAELKTSNVELERFAHVASHDLQEPLRMITSFLQLLEKKLGGSLNETNKQYIDFAIDGAERMKKLINDLLEYSRLNNNAEGFKNVDCNEILHTVSSFYKLLIDETQVKLYIKPLPVICGRQPRIQQLFQNLVGNALKYRSDKIPEIEIGSTEYEAYWQFYVKDNGIGIDPKFYEKIFIIFQRLHNKAEYSGTGIGLSICKKIVDNHGGRIWVESELGKGSTFYFTIQKNIS